MSLRTEDFATDTELTEEEASSLNKRRSAFIEESKRFRQPYETEWLKNYKLFNMYREELPAEERWRSNLHIPTTATMILTIVPILVSPFMTTVKNFARMLPLNSKDPNDLMRAEMNEKYAQWQLRQDVFPLKQTGIIMECCCYGNAFGKVTWETVVKNVRRRQRITLWNGPNPVEIANQLVRKQETLYDGCRIDHIDLYYLYPDPRGSTNIADMRRYAHNVFMYPAQVKELFDSETFKFMPWDTNVTIDDLSDMSADDQFAEQRLSSIGMGAVNDGSGAGESRRIKIQEFYENDNYSWWINDKYLVRFEECPNYYAGHNLFKYDFIPKFHELYGKGLCTLLQPINDNIDYVTNARNDHLTLMVNRPWLVDVDMLDEDDRDLEISPMGMIRLSGAAENGGVLNALQPMPMAPVDSSLYREPELMHNFAQMLTGAADIVRGMGKGTTATGDTIRTNQAMGRLGWHSKYIASIAIPRMLKLMQGQNALSMTDTVSFYITAQQQSVTFSPDDLLLDYDIIPVMDENESTREIARQQFMQAIQANQNPITAPYNNWPKIVHDLWAQFEFIENAEQYVQIPPPMPPGAPMGPPPGPAPPGGGPPGAPPPAMMPPAVNQIDMMRQQARGAIGNGDANFEA